jgi:hypothetical protein
MTKLFAALIATVFAAGALPRMPATPLLTPPLPGLPRPRPRPSTSRSTPRRPKRRLRRLKPLPPPPATDGRFGGDTEEPRKGFLAFLRPAIDVDSPVTAVPGARQPGAAEPAPARLAAERAWQPFHSPKNLASALIVEAGELLEHFQWLTEDQSRALAQAGARQGRGGRRDGRRAALPGAAGQRAGGGPAGRRRPQDGGQRAKYPVEKARGRADRASEL